MNNIKTVNGIGDFNLDTLVMLIDDDSVMATFELSSVSPEFEKKIHEEITALWGDKETVITDTALRFICEEGNFTYYIDVGFHSAENNVEADTAYLEIKLSDEDINEFVGIIIRAIMKKFFNR